MHERVGDGLLHPVGRRQRILVRRQLDGVVNAELALELLGRLARLVGSDPQDVLVGQGLPLRGHALSSIYAAGYEPRILRNRVRSASSVRAPATTGVSRWPSKSTNMTKSHRSRLVGRDSILVRLIPIRANGSRMR